MAAAAASAAALDDGAKNTMKLENVRLTCPSLLQPQTPNGLIELIVYCPSRPRRETP